MARGRVARPAWVARSSVVVAALGALALATTVVVARRALEDASEVVVRGEGGSLVAALQSELSSHVGDGAESLLDAALTKHEAEGLRYIGLLQGGALRAHAGEASIPGTAGERAGALRVGRHRVRLTASLGPPRPPGPRGDFPFAGDRPPWHDHHPPPDGIDRAGPGRPQDDAPPFEDDPGAPPDRPSGHGPFDRMGPPRGGPPLLVVEFETPVLDRLRSDVTRTVVVAAAAAAALLAFAAAWSRSMLKLTAATEKAEREHRLVELGQMSGVMAHELRNPLASLKGHAQLLEETLGDCVDATSEAGNLDAEDVHAAIVRAHAKAARVVGDAERLERLTSSLLEFAREGAIDRAATSPREIVDRALEHLPEATVHVDVDGAPSSLLGDAGRLARALGNLVENAAHAGGDEPVEVSARGDGDAIVFEVRDHGKGLPADSKDRIFEPFVTTKTRGTGLGLAIARRIAELHGGTLTGETHPEGGAIFTLRIPRS